LHTQPLNSKRRTAAGQPGSTATSVSATSPVGRPLRRGHTRAAATTPSSPPSSSL
jgi:hypothetical protein